jgi:AhpD family alkylhydroperoxidase
MSETRIKQFQEDREYLNDVVIKYAGLSIKRFYNLDSQVYKEGILPQKTKEMLGLVASFVLRCDDCVTYHLIRCQEEGMTDEEIEEVLSVGLIVGGSITIPHLRRAFQAWEELKHSK